MFREYKTFAQILSVGLLLFAPVLSGEESAWGPQPALHLSVDDVIERVKSQNLQLLINKESVQRALEQSYQRRAALLPHFTLRAQQTQKQLAQGFDGSAFMAPPFYSFGSRIETSLAVFDTQRYADFRLARLNHAIEQLDYATATADILEQAIMIYFTHLRNLRSVEISLGNLKREEELLELAEQQFEAGAAVKINVTRAEVRVVTVKRQLMEAETAVEESALQMKALLDIDLEQDIRLDRSIIEGVNAPPPIKKYGSLEALTEIRPELQAQQKVLEQAELTKKAAAWQRLPSIELFADWGYDTNRAFDGEEGEAWHVGLRGAIPIWEGGRFAAERREAAANLRQNEYRMRDLRNQIEREFKHSLLEMESRYEQIDIARDEVHLGKDEMTLARERYREGLADNRELIDAQQRLAEAERSHLRAIYLYGLSRLAFARSIGAVERILE